MNQSLRLRPWDGDVLLVAGKEALLANHLELATTFWRRSFQSGPTHRDRLIDVFVQQQVPLEFLAEHFASVLDATSCERLVRKYDAAGIAGPSPLFLRHMATVACREAKAAEMDDVRRWMLACDAYQRLGDVASLVDCVEQVAKMEPTDFGLRRRLAMIMIDHELFDEARPHVRWCLRRKPHDRGLRQANSKIIESSVGQSSRVRLVSGESELPSSGRD